MKLRPYQQELVDQLRAAFGNGRRCPLLVLPTGGGKTVIFTEIAKRMAAKGNHCCILVHRQELLMQASRALREMGVQHGLIAPGWQYRGELLAVASVQTLASRLKKMTPEQIARLLPFKLLIVDEGHHIVAGQWKTITAAISTALQLPVTATPGRADGKGLGVQAGGPCDDMVRGPSIQWLIDEGYLVRPITYAPPTKVDLSAVHMRGGDYNAKELSQAVDKPRITGDAVAHYARLCGHKPAIAFCASVEHAEHVASEFRAAGFAAQCLDGSMSDGARRAGIQGLADGTLHVLTSCDLISEGTDIPVVTAAILLRPTQSEGLYLQQVGRALRPVYAPGFDLSTREGRLAAIAASIKPHALLLDHVGNCLIHGLAQDDREWSLEGRQKSGRKKPSKDAVNLRQCPSCYAFHEPAPKCPHCGHAYEATGREIEQVAGELKPLTDAEIQAIKAKRKQENRRAATPEELLQLALDRGYKSPVFWVKNYLKARGTDLTANELFGKLAKVKQQQKSAASGMAEIFKPLLEGVKA